MGDGLKRAFAAAKATRKKRTPVTITVLVPVGGKVVQVSGEDANGNPVVLAIM